METREMRVSGPLEIREVDGKPVISGYAAKYGTRSLPIRDMFVETIAPGAFDRTLKEGGVNVRAYYNHKGMPLASTKAGTLKLSTDDVGLRFEFTPPDTTLGKDVTALIRTGDIWGCSFAFRCVKEAWEERKDDMPLRTLQDVDLYDVTVTDDPAYEDTSVAVRCFQERQNPAGFSALDLMRLRLAEAE